MGSWDVPGCYEAFVEAETEADLTRGRFEGLECCSCKGKKNWEKKDLKDWMLYVPIAAREMPAFGTSTCLREWILCSFMVEISKEESFDS